MPTPDTYEFTFALPPGTTVELGGIPFTYLGDGKFGGNTSPVYTNGAVPYSVIQELGLTAEYNEHIAQSSATLDEELSEFENNSSTHDPDLLVGETQPVAESRCRMSPHN